MARRPAHNEPEDSIPKAISQHISELGFAGPDQYSDWCYNNGFGRDFRIKSRADLLDEKLFFQDAQARRRQQNRLHKHSRAFLEAVCLGELSSGEIDRPGFKQIAQTVEASNEAKEARESLLEMLLVLVKHKDFIFDAVAGQNNRFLIHGIIKLHDRKALWLRPLEGWRPKTKNNERRFGELAHYLFDQYGDVPRFMDSVWLRGDRASWRYRDWFVHLGRGHNLRTAKSVIQLTKRMAHHFLQAPDNYTVEQAIRWGQSRALGAGESAVHALAATRLGRSLENESFWFTVLRFIAENPMLDPRQTGPMVDYLQNQRFEPMEVEVAPGIWRTQPPPQPGLSMNGRTVTTLMGQIDAWHNSLGKFKDLPTQTYEESNFLGITIERKNGRDVTHWSIRQLRNAKDLKLESDELNHCVVSYHWSCVRGHCTIWSLSSSENGNDYKRRQTIEVSKSGEIVQCRGLANRDPKPEEWSVVNAWARETNLSIASYF